MMLGTALTLKAIPVAWYCDMNMPRRLSIRIAIQKPAVASP